MRFKRDKSCIGDFQALTKLSIFSYDINRVSIFDRLVFYFRNDRCLGIYVLM